MNQTIIYEQPLSETIRVCLRLEHLFQQIDHQLNDTSMLAARNVITYIINTLQVLDRPDLKAKLAKELGYHVTNLMRFGDMPDIDSAKLNKLTEQLDKLSQSLIDSSGKIGHRLRDIELFNMLRLHLASPGGGCNSDAPLFHHWLQQSTEKRREAILNWLNDFAQIRTASNLVLDLMRKNAKTEQKTAVHGFHQELLDPNANLRMLRIGVPQDIAAYPEISVGRHFLSVRFFSPDIEKRPAQFTENMLFWLAYCTA